MATIIQFPGAETPYAFEKLERIDPILAGHAKRIADRSGLTLKYVSFILIGSLQMAQRQALQDAAEMLEAPELMTALGG